MLHNISEEHISHCDYLTPTSFMSSAETDLSKGDENKLAVHLKKLMVTQLVNKFPAFYGTERLITMFTTAHHLSLP
jgi:hypothetical protein